ncbi:MAG: IclR family transcriptional regulator [Actinobacteria bacterium]|nr:IclR family transcriptional regulator [Actinomycetota bacterium]
MKATTNGQPRATDRGLALVRVVADHPSGIALADAARAVDLTPSTTLRQLRSLEAAGFAERDDDGRFVPGAELLRIARSLASSAALPRLAEPVLAALAALTGESAYLAEPADGRHAIYAAMESGTHAVRHVSWLGQRVPLKGTAVGAALIGDVEADGTAVRTDAVEEGVTAVSAPVFGPNAHVIGAISVVGPSYRLVGPRLRSARAAVAEQATALSALAGGPASAPSGSRRRRTARTPGS